MQKLQENQFDPYIEEVNMLPIVKILEPTDSLKWKTTRFPHTESTFVYEYFNFKVLNSGSGNSHEKVPILIVTNSNIGKNQVKIGGLNETNFFFYLYQEKFICMVLFCRKNMLNKPQFYCRMNGFTKICIFLISKRKIFPPELNFLLDNSVKIRKKI